MRDRLIELIKPYVSGNGCEQESGSCEFISCRTCNARSLADHLLANGVTVQEWISVKDRLPEDLVDVLTCDAKGNIHVMWHHHEFSHPFNVRRNDLRYYPVTHWMPLPQPPKGE